MGYVDSFKDYAEWLWKANILPVTSNQDFFGGSVVEAIYCNCFPLLPNRLAYPEHLPVSDDMFFNNFEELCVRLKNLIINFQDLNNVSRYIRKYDWNILIDKYDKEFMEIKKLY
jgi:hypothetical protein